MILCWFFASLTAANSAPYEALDRVVAVVNTDIVAQSELDARIDDITRQLLDQRRRIPPQDILARQVLDRIVIEKLQLQRAESLGIRVDDETLNRTVQRIAAENGLTLHQFRETLERDGYDFEKFRADIRREIVIRRLQERQVHQRILITEQDIENFLASDAFESGADFEFHLAHILVALPEAATPEQLAEGTKRLETIQDMLRTDKTFAEVAIEYSDGQQALEGGDLGWRKGAELPTLFADVVPDLAVNDISQPIRSPSGLHIIKLLDKRGGSQHMIRQTLARHILIKPNALTTEEQAQQLLQELTRRIDGGEAFEDLAREYSDDAGTAVDGGQLKWLKPGETVPAFEKVMNHLEQGEISAPFRSPFGWHIVQVLGRRNIDDTDDFQRQQAREALMQRKISEETELWLRRLRDEAYVDYRKINAS
jgi:peptidyl-prolyl cis-trans isomerase SurA